MRKNEDDVLIIDEDFKCSAECQRYFLNMFGDLNVAYSAGRINKKTYKQNYKSIDINMRANMKFLSKKQKSQLAIGRKEFEKKIKANYKQVKLADLVKNSDTKMLESPTETEIVEVEIEPSK